MFTGIVTDMGEILELEQKGDLRARIATAYDPAGIDIDKIGKGPRFHAVDVDRQQRKTAAEAPLSLITTKIVLSNSPSDFTCSTRRPT